MNTLPIMACHQCDALCHIGPLSPGHAARCWRCGAVLAREIRNSLDRTLALIVAGLIFFVVANSFPVLGLKIQSQVHQASLVTGVKALYHQGMWAVALLVFFTTMVIPLLYLLGMLYVLLPLRLGWHPPHLARIFIICRKLSPWSMLEVFMIGILVSIVKLIHLATIIPGPAIYSFAALILVLAGSMAALDPRIIWNKLGTNS